MLEVVIPGIRHGEAKINSSSAYRGCHCFIAGVDSDGYQLMQLPYTTAHCAKALYPVNKYYFAEDLSDTSDALVAYPALDADGYDTITMDGSTTGGLQGDVYRITDIAAGKFLLEGHQLATGVVATPLSAAVS